MRYLVAGLFGISLALGTLPKAPAGDDESIKPVNLDKVNTDADEDDPFLAADGLALYYASNATGTFDILVAQRRTAASTWLPGKRLRLNSKTSDARSPFVRRGILYFASNKVPDESLKDLKNFDLYQKTAVRAPLPILGVSEKEDELYPWITPSGNTFYFSRKTEEGWRLFAANGPVPGPISNATVMDLPVGFHHATVSSDLLVMCTCKGRWKRKTRRGLFRTTRPKVGACTGASPSR